MKLDIKELLDFLDDKKDSEKGDANAIISVFGEELNASAYKHFRNNKVEILSDSVTQGTKSGHRLDRWIVDGNLLYQCEIKNWAATAIGGKQLKSDANSLEIGAIAREHWDQQLKSDLSDFGKHPNGVTKVLLKMKPPDKYKSLEVEPLLIYWMPISPDKEKLNPLFLVPVENFNLPMKNIFSKLSVFSVSLYLRQLYNAGNGEKIIDLEMPKFEHRTKIMERFKK